MKNIKKILTLAVLTLALVFVFCSCGDEVPYSDYNLDEYITLGAFPSIEYSASEVDSEVEEALEEIATNNKVTEEITDRAAQDGDTVDIDYEGKIDGETFDGGSSEGYSLVIGSDTFISGFEDGIIGHNIGDEFELNLTFPEDYSNDPDVAGKDVVFSVKLNGISAEVTPEITDELVAANSDYSTVEEYKAAEKEEVLRDVVWDNLVDECTVIKLAEKEMKTYYNNVLSNYKSYAMNSGYTLENFVTMYGYSSEEDFLESTLDSAADTVKEEMILYSIVKKNDITISSDEYKTLGEAKATELGSESLSDLEDSYGKTYVNKLLLQDKVVDILVENAVAK